MSEQASRLRKKWLSLLMRREYSQRELKQKATGFDDVLIIEMLQEFEQNGWQSDLRYAQALLRNRYNRGKGSLLIRHELKDRGVRDEHIDEAFLEYPRALWVEQCQLLYKKKFPVASKNFQEQQKRMQFLARRGIDPDIIREVVQ